MRKGKGQRKSRRKLKKTKGRKRKEEREVKELCLNNEGKNKLGKNEEYRDKQSKIC